MRDRIREDNTAEKRKMSRPREDDKQFEIDSERLLRPYRLENIEEPTVWLQFSWAG